MAVTIITFIVTIATMLILGINYSAYSLAFAALANGILLGFVIKKL